METISEKASTDGTSDSDIPKSDSREFEHDEISFFRLLQDHWISVTIDCLCFTSFWNGCGLSRATLFDLGCQTSSDAKEMNWVFFVQLLMTLIGSISAGCLAEKTVPLRSLLIIGSLGMSLMMFLIPSCSMLSALLCNLMVMGWCMGMVDCVANLRMFLRYETNVSPFLQGMHFCYGLGAFVSPMIAQPFLLNVDCTPFIDGYTVTPSVSNLTANSTTSPVTKGEKEQTTKFGVILSPESGNETISVPPSPHHVSRAQHLSRSENAFYILGSIQLIIALLVILVTIVERKRGMGHSFSNTAIKQKGEYCRCSNNTISNEKENPGFFRRCFACGPKEVVVITLAVSVSRFWYDGLQSSFGDYIYSYAEKNVKGLQDEEGAYLNSCFWGHFAFGLLLAIPIATKCTAAFMLLCSIIGAAFSLLMTYIWKTSRVAIYIGTCTIGFFLSSMSPSVMAMTEQFVDINPSITSSMVVFGAMGEMLCPVIVGNLFVTMGPTSFLSFCCIVIVVVLVLYAGLYYIGRKTQKYRDSNGNSFIFLTGYARRKAGESTLINPTAIKYYSELKDEQDTVKPEKLELTPRALPDERPAQDDGRSHSR
ncbi:hypothetical protein ScPMuIL_007796 [Solemya velum]